MKALDLTGQRFGRLVVKEFAHCFNKKRYWLCLCDCGKIKIVGAALLRNGSTKSCGCLHDEACADRARKHGMRDRREYGIWCGMRQRCNNPKSISYPNYGGRGITVCERWNSFESFLEDIGPIPDECESIDRINNDGHYEPGNCRWATRKEQNNNKRNCVLITWNGKTQNVRQWERELGMPPHKIKQRLREGWSVERALAT